MSQICPGPGPCKREDRFVLVSASVVFSVGIGLSSSKNAAADYRNSVLTIDEPFPAVVWPKLLKGRGLWKEDELKERVGRAVGPGVGMKNINYFIKFRYCPYYP
ncbi:hypothetical protein TNCV_3997281 [Trichonephila clavipes]|nr:hypothetical protein TNCV_3997281 [Trichonephila clavipes]